MEHNFSRISGLLLETNSLFKWQTALNFKEWVILKRKILLFFILVVVFILVACSSGNVDSVEEGKESGFQKEAPAVEDYIGQQIDIKEDGTIQLPFDEQVLVATFSEDGAQKIFGIEGVILLIDDDEIVYAEEHKSIFHLHSDEITISDDGRFAAWRNHMENFEISIYDFESQTAYLIEETEELDPYMVFTPFLITNYDNGYYLSANTHLVGSSPPLIVDLNEMKLTDSRELIEKISPKEPVEDDDTYHEIRAEASTLGLNDGIYSEYGYYNFYFDYEDYDEDDISLTLTKLYGNDVTNGVLSEIQLEGLDFEQDDIEVFRFTHKLLDTLTLKVSDNGMFIIPVVDGDLEENNYQLSVYVANLTDKNPVAKLLVEEDVTEERPTVFFNEDNSAIYVSKKGELQKYNID